MYKIFFFFFITMPMWCHLGTTDCMAEGKGEWKRVASHGESCEVLEGRLGNGKFVRIGNMSLSSAWKGKHRPW